MSTSTSKTIIFEQFGQSDVLKVKEVPVPSVGDGQVRVKVAAVGLNRAEALIRAGIFFEKPTLPSGIGYEGAGTVEAIGKGVTKFKVGDRVVVIPTARISPSSTTNSEHIVFPENLLAPIPANQSFADAAATWTAYLTAYFAIYEYGITIKSTDTVVITAASSSVALAFIHYVKSFGATVIATSRTNAKKDQIIAQGADHFIATGEEDLVKRIRELTKGAGANLFLDPVGGAQLEKLVFAAAYEASFIIYGTLSREPAVLPVGATIGNHLTIKGYSVLSFYQNPQAVERAQQFITKFIATHKVPSIVGQVLKGIESIPAGHMILDSADLFGKVIVEF
ncbi:hypothetical protein SAMD00019534_116900 [Acytostelium subglobosum LB1]|uniref:hypothetical protein n=1 Tax=Acytostelium subglobosum LB1 TaxID=1410327 RepID=UPI0006449C16|nr:hypothetical protein SAMD00019534_116900 [Acytostelium subglobosum LB1]GAM28514.1 hypothetical protein SAMD00019534_116900 [Acytostelium subglobosum LB1]|eukprot:XP_012748553.1 hypothetical protein SAMD00019534_116900 [Acytostelium subglobosum LB1]